MKKTILRLTALSIFVLLNIQCVSKKTPPPDEPTTTDDTQLDLEASSASKPGEPKKAGSKLLATPYEHPIRATNQATKELLMAYHFESLSNEITQCQKELKDLESLTQNEQQLIGAIRTLEPTVSKNKKAYHWCFYVSVSKLEDYLEGESASINEKLNHFLGTMKSLWVLSRVLDTVKAGDEDEDDETDAYFSYLRIRYQQISQKYFGRKTSIFKKPLDFYTDF